MADTTSLQVHCFLDTSVFLECVIFHNVDWRSEFRADEVCLLLAPSVVDELERYKTDPRSDRKRNRAKSVIATLAKNLGDAIVTRQGARLKDGVWVRLLTGEAPDEYFGQHRLSYHQGDDRLMASVLAFAEAGATKLLLTADYGLCVRAKSRSIDARLVRDDLLEPDETSAHTREIRKLEARITELEQQLTPVPDSTLKRRPSPTIEHAVNAQYVMGHYKYAYLQLAVHPITADHPLYEGPNLTDIAEQKWNQGNQQRQHREMLTELLADAAGWDIFPRRYDPELRSVQGWDRVQGGWRARRTAAEPGPSFDPGPMLDLSVERDGKGSLFCGRAGEVDTRGRKLIFEDSIASLTTRFLYLMGGLYELAEYTAAVDVGLAATNLQDGVSSRMIAEWSAWYPTPYEPDRYIATERFDAQDLRQRPRECAEALTEELFGVLTGDSYSPFDSLPDWHG